MKHAGSTFEYEQQRDESLLRAYRALLQNAPDGMPQNDIFALTVQTPCERFWVSEERAVAVISRMASRYHQTLRYMRPQKRRMYREIYRRVAVLMERDSRLSRREAVEEVVAGQAPEFYLTPGSAKVILCRMKKKRWYQERKRRLRHLF